MARSALMGEKSVSILKQVGSASEPHFTKCEHSHNAAFRVRALTYRRSS